MPKHRYIGPAPGEVKEAIGQWVREYLKNHPNDPQVELAERLGVSEGTISNIKYGKFKPGFPMLIRIEFAFGTGGEAMRRHLRRNDYPPEIKVRGRRLAR